MANIIERVSIDPVTGAQGNEESRTPSLSHNGNFVAFESDASALAAGASAIPNALLYDRAADTLVRLNPTDQGKFPSVSGNGDVVAFVSSASGGGVTQGFSVYNRSSGSLDDVVRPASGFIDDLKISANGRFVAFRSQGDSLALNGSSVLYDGTGGVEASTATPTRLSSSAALPVRGAGRWARRGTPRRLTRRSRATATSSPSPARPRTSPTATTPTRSRTPAMP